MSDSRFRRRISTFDAFPKVERQLAHTTKSGGILTLLSSALMAFLVLGEIRDYMTPHLNHEFLVDHSLTSKMMVNLDLSVLMKCEHLTIDLVDSSGESLHLSEKFSLAAVPFGKSLLESMPPTSPSFFALNSQSLSPEDAMAREATRSKMGCRIRGSVPVNKVAGNLHITALGHGYGGAHVPHEEMNFTHKFDTLTFGQSYPNLVNPLNDYLEVATENFEMYQYFVQLIPTIYNPSSGPFSRAVVTNQYAVKSQKRIMTDQRGLPGIFIKYDSESLLVRISDDGPGLVKTILRSCSIAGGLFVTIGLVNSFILLIYGKFFSKKNLSLNTTSRYSSLPADSNGKSSNPSSPASFYSDVQSSSAVSTPLTSSFSGSAHSSPYPQYTPSSPPRSSNTFEDRRLGQIRGSGLNSSPSSPLETLTPNPLLSSLSPVIPNMKKDS